MNQALSLLHSHHSDRSFTDEPVSEEALCAILEAGRRAPTATNAQHVSVVVVRDAERRARIAEYAGGQPWIAKAPVFLVVLVDFYKPGIGVESAGERMVIQESTEGLVSAVTDAGIVLTSMMIAARSLGLGIVPIGGIRRNLPGMIELLGCPPLTFPLVGLTIGHVNRAGSCKPRLPMQLFRHNECYQSAGMAEAIKGYDAELMEYWKSIGRTDGLPWSQNTAESYAQLAKRQVKAALQQQKIPYER